MSVFLCAETSHLGTYLSQIVLRNTQTLNLVWPANLLSLTRCVFSGCLMALSPWLLLVQLIPSHYANPLSLFYPFSSSLSLSLSPTVFFPPSLRCGSKQGEEDYRPLFENFVQDLLSTVNKPEWPAAELLLSLLGRLLVSMTEPALYRRCNYLRFSVSKIRWSRWKALDSFIVLWQKGSLF